MPPDDARIHALEDNVGDLRHQIAGLLQREATRTKSRQVRIAKVVGASSSSSSALGLILEIVALDCSSPGDEQSSSSSSSTSAVNCNCYPIVFLDVDAPGTPGEQPLTVLPRQPEDDPLFVVHTLDEQTVIPVDTILSVFRHNKKDRFWTDRTNDGGLVGVKLAEQHPGRFTHFEVYLGTWNPVTTRWDFNDLSTTYTAMDQRYDVPYPDAGATGLAAWRSWIGGG